MSTPPNQPGDADTSKPEMPVEKQLDQLLVQVEEVEPGSDVTSSNAAQPTSPKPNPAAQIDAVLNSPPAETATQEKTPEQEQMLAALNDALQGIDDNEPDEALIESPDLAEAPPSEAGLSAEDKLQQEIAALMDAEPQVDTEPADAAAAGDADDIDALEGSFETPEALAAIEAAAGETTSTEDQIAMEIEGLLSTGPAEPAMDTADDAAIDELDKMLAQEIDEDDELAGDFQSVEDLTAGIQVEDAMGLAEDEHAATARDVALELDSQPEDLPTKPEEPAGASAGAENDPLAVLSEIADAAEHNERAHQRGEAMQKPSWQHWLTVGKAHLLSTCYAINWPARRFLTAEWRANLGYIAILNLFFGVGWTGSRVASPSLSAKALHFSALGPTLPSMFKGQPTTSAPGPSHSIRSRSRRKRSASLDVLTTSNGVTIPPTAAQDGAKSDTYWRHFDERYPEIAGKGEYLWNKAGEIATLQVGEQDEEAFATRQNLVFQALAVNERDHAIMRKEAKTKAEHDWILSRRDASRQFEKDVETIKALRAKPEGELSQADMTQMLQASVSLMQYIYEAQIQANESYFENVVKENQALQDKLAKQQDQPAVEPKPESKPEPEAKPEPESESETESTPSGGSREAEKGDFKAYLQPDRIKISGDNDQNEYDRNHVQITGAIKNQTNKPAKFRFQVLGLRSDKRVVGLKTITTPVIPAGGVHEIDERMAVEHSAYVRGVDMREVTVIEP
eukprot:g12211.t1